MYTRVKEMNAAHVYTYRYIFICLPVYVYVYVYVCINKLHNICSVCNDYCHPFYIYYVIIDY